MKFSKKSQENARSSSPSAGDPDDFVLVPSQVLNKNIAFPSHPSPSLLLHKDVYLSVCACVCVCVDLARAFFFSQSGRIHLLCG